MEHAALLIGIGLGGGFAAGLLGLGGSILLVPLLLAIPPAAGQAPLSLGAALSFSLVPILFAAGATALRKPAVPSLPRPTALFPGGVSAVAGLVGGFLSAKLSDGGLHLLFGAACAAAALLPLVRRRGPGTAADGVRRGSAALTAGLAGLALGLVGSAGGLLLAPFLQDRLSPSAAGARGPVAQIILAGALAGLLGKLLTRQVGPGLVAALVLGACPGAWWGGELAERLDQRRLDRAALAIGAAVALWAWSEILMYPSS